MTDRLQVWEPQLPDMEDDSGYLLGMTRYDGMTSYLVGAFGIVEEYPTRREAERRLSQLMEKGHALWSA